MSFKDLDREKHSPLWPFLVTLLVAAAALAVFLYVAIASSAHAQTPGVDLTNRPLPHPVITQESHQAVVAASGHPLAEDIPPNSFYWHWLASGFAIRAEQAARVTLEQQLYLARMGQAEAETLLAQCRAENSVSPKRVGKFLWKPESENTGKLAVLTDTADIDAFVQGDELSEELSDSGPSNGYGVTARGKNPGCAFGHDVLVTFTDDDGKVVLTKKGDQAVIIPNGCDRTLRTF